MRNAGIKSGERNFGSNCFSLVRRLVGTDENKEVRRLGLNRRGGSRVVVRELLIGGLIILSRAARGRGLGGSRGGRSLSGSGLGSRSGSVKLLIRIGGPALKRVLNIFRRRGLNLAHERNRRLRYEQGAASGDKKGDDSAAEKAG